VAQLPEEVGDPQYFNTIHTYQNEMVRTVVADILQFFFPSPAEAGRGFFAWILQETQASSAAPRCSKHSGAFR
jgi:hypothetical protein